MNLGCALTELQCEREAADCFRRALALSPGHAEARHNLGSGQLLALLSRAELPEEELLARHRAWGGRTSWPVCRAFLSPRPGAGCRGWPSSPATSAAMR